MSCVITQFEIGSRWGRWTILSLSSIRTVRGKAQWLCRCDCGVEKLVGSSDLRSGGSKSCGCLRKRNIKALGLSNHIPGTILHELWYKYRYSAERRGIVFDIPQQLFLTLIANLCSYCGAAPSGLLKRPQESLLYNGIDRVDNSKGYVEGNVVTCCKWCNKAKSTMSLDEFRSWVQRVADRFSAQELHVAA